MTKCNFVDGNKKLFDSFMNTFAERVQQIDIQHFRNEIKQMRIKMISSEETGFHIKRSKGGLLEIDFIISYLILTNISDNFSLIGKSLDEKLQMVKSDFTDNKVLLSNYKFLKTVELHIQSITDSRTNKLPIDLLQLRKLSLQSGFENEKEFTSHFNTITKMNIDLFKKIFGEK